VTPADGMGRDHAAGVQSPSLARAHVSVGIGVSLENVPGGRTLGVGEEPARVEYLFPPITALEEQELCLAYEALTGRRVWPKMLPLLRVIHRRHGPDMIRLLGDLYEEGGVQYLLLRLRDYPPRQASFLTSSEAAPHRPAAPSPAASAHVNDEGEADRVAAIAPPFGLENQEPTRDEKKCSGDGADLGAWCGCPEAHLRPNVLYCEAHRPRFGSVPKLRYDRRISNPATAGFLAAAATGQSAAGAPRP
jgi:hypothetical protein